MPDRHSWRFWRRRAAERPREPGVAELTRGLRQELERYRTGPPAVPVRTVGAEQTGEPERPVEGGR